MAKQQLTHGGKRAGAGRPAIYKDRGKISVVMEQRLIDRMTKRAEQLGVSLSQAVASACEAWLAAGR